MGGFGGVFEVVDAVDAGGCGEVGVFGLPSHVSRGGFCGGGSGVVGQLE